MWYYEAGGRQHGPVPVEELTAKAASGEIHAGSLVWQEGMGDWAPLSQACPQAIPAAPASSGGAPPGAAASPYAPPGAAPGHRPGGGYMEPHRGTLILVLGILGLAVCCVCGIVAWVMGNADLQKMDAGQMDPEGRGLTQAGRIIGMVCVIMNIVGGIIGVLLGIAMASTGY